MMSSLESEKIQHKETIENYESHIEEFNRKMKCVEDDLRKQKEINVNHELESKKVTVELREAARHAESKLSDAYAEIDRNEKNTGIIRTTTRGFACCKIGDKTIPIT